MMGLAIGNRVRVVDPTKHLTDQRFVGEEGLIVAPRDEYGRWGVNLDRHPRKHKHWHRWYHPDFLEPA